MIEHDGYYQAGQKTQTGLARTKAPSKFPWGKGTWTVLLGDKGTRIVRAVPVPPSAAATAWPLGAHRIGVPKELLSPRPAPGPDK